MEYEQLLNVISRNPAIVCIITDLEKGTILVSLYVRPTNNKRKTDFIGVVSEEVYFDLQDQDLSLCSKIITQGMNGLHWKSSKGYVRGNHVEYYLRPDWKYWYSLK